MPHPKASFGPCSQSVAENVRTLRETMGLSQRELAERVGWSKLMIQRLEAGVVAPKVDQVCELAQGLGVSVARLLKASAR